MPMLERIETGKYSYDEPAQVAMKIGDAKLGKNFPWRLEYNCPVHENWNIVHTGMLIPEAHQIYVCSDNCLRGVILTADEMNAIDRISSVMPTENEVVTGKLEEVTIDGVTDVINRLSYRPKAVELFLVCMHHQIGVDERYIYNSLKKRFPDIYFIPCYMDPIMQKVSLTPEQKQRKSMMLALYSKDEHADLNYTLKGAEQPASIEEAYPNIYKEHHKIDTAAILGDNLRLPDTSDISRLLTFGGFKVEQVQDKKTFEEYREMGKSTIFITRSSLSVYGLKALSKRDNKNCYYLPPVATDGEIEEELFSLIDTVKNVYVDSFEQFLTAEEIRTRRFFRWARETIGRTEITLDYLCFPRPLNFARRLLKERFNVTTVFLDSVSPEEKEDFKYLRKYYPELILHSTNHVLSRPSDEAVDKKILALGPKAAYFSQTDYFVNWIENDGNFGYDGLRKLCKAMVDAYNNPKDRKAIVQRKGLYNPSCFE